ncbi:hypothetical protein Pst134EB_018657 [Puccinia striiformis f. sp. tritici]|nr:hypothetical protein Pst134EB_018657 [Puccinia striiformis f. sp. tritici]KNF03794.1 hypothetical protein PSTG_02890 [Puccinia striiformis f. sp. tritici PST-78]
MSIPRLLTRITKPIYTLSNRRCISSTSSSCTKSFSMAHHRRLRMIDNHLSSSSTRRTYSSSPHQESSIVTRIDGHLRTLILNRPASLNAVNLEMVESITNQLIEWENSDSAKTIILKGNGRSFCAGGDVVSLIKSAQSSKTNEQKKGVEFFRSEYKLDSFISKMETPMICFLDGITMGGGMGLSMHTPFRIATENTQVAMPETAIGLFPDVGATFFLPRLDGELGTYLGLTGTSLHGWGAFQAGIASHYVPSNSLKSLEDRLTSIVSKQTTHDQINDTINEFAADPIDSIKASKYPFDLNGTKRQVIDHCFSQPTLEKILQELTAVKDGHIFVTNDNDDNLRKWAQKTIDLILIRSPTSCLITLLALREGKKMNIDDCFKMELRLAATCCDIKTHPDFVTGVTHLLINKQKTRPEWSPSELSQLNQDEIIQRYFSNQPPSSVHLLPLDLIPTRMKAYENYPFSNYGLPSEEYIKSLVIGNVRGTSGHLAITKEELIQSVKSKWTGKVGVSLKVDDILDRRTIVKGANEGSVLKWQY